MFFQRFRSTAAMLLFVGCWIVISNAASAGLVVTGSQYSMVNQNFPINFTELETLTLDGSVKSLGGTDLTVREVITPTANGEWLEFVFERPAAPLAGNPNRFWRTDIFDIKVSEPIIFDGFQVYWTIDGVAVANPGTDPFGLGDPIDNLINPSLGKVYGASFQGSLFNSPLNFFTSLSRYRFILENAGMDSDAINGFRLGAHLSRVQSSVVPEPNSLALFGTGILGILISLRRRRKEIV